MIPPVRLVFPVLETTPQRWVQLASMLPPALFQRYFSDHTITP